MELLHPDGRVIRYLERHSDHKGDYLLLEHRIPTPRIMSGPHWHPHLVETFTVQEGTMKLIIDKKEMLLHAGETLTIEPNQTHQFWNIGEQALIVQHKIQPPGKHGDMFRLIHKLETEGKLTSKGIPKNPLWLGLAWECIDGYLVGPPPLIQRTLLGGLAALARLRGYKI
ncbi:cupin domain-containing protein [Alkalicoccobacillus porphyridii]|uniref:cupin domain-containing protein n=1 Tax=Alkalicoccobacillus porphyridii TaxID=2597270 RepID=UPI0021B11AC0|nr:cupin domain-containing protein [Alkalicoccobacillus porphyridii]